MAKRKHKCKHGKRLHGKCPRSPGGKRAPRSKVGRLVSSTPLAQRTCARNSLRAVMPPGRPDVRIIICCPVNQWSDKAKRCSVPLKAHAKKKYRVGGAV